MVLVDTNTAILRWPCRTIRACEIPFRASVTWLQTVTLRQSAYGLWHRPLQPAGRPVISARISSYRSTTPASSGFDVQEQVVALTFCFLLLQDSQACAVLWRLSGLTLGLVILAIGQRLY